MPKFRIFNIVFSLCTGEDPGKGSLGGGGGGVRSNSLARQKKMAYRKSWTGLWTALWTLDKFKKDRKSKKKKDQKKKERKKKKENVDGEQLHHTICRNCIHKASLTTPAHVIYNLSIVILCK